MSSQPIEHATRDPRDDGWSWVNPADPRRFLRATPSRSGDLGTPEVLRNIVRFADEIFGYLTVLEHNAEARSRGASGDAKRRDTAALLTKLRLIEADLEQVQEACRELAVSFVSEQIASRTDVVSTTPLKVNLGCAGNTLAGWVNIDAGGGDLTLNVNWGLPFSDNSVDYVYCAHLLEHLRYRDQAPALLAEIYRVLKPGSALRLVVPDVERLLQAYTSGDAEYFRARARAYPVLDSFVQNGVPMLDYILLFCGASPQHLSYNHKFGYDFNLLRSLLVAAGYSVLSSSYQSSTFPELRVDHVGYNAGARDDRGNHFSLFVDAIKE